MREKKFEFSELKMKKIHKVYILIKVLYYKLYTHTKMKSLSIDYIQSTMMIDFNLTNVAKKKKKGPRSIFVIFYFIFQYIGQHPEHILLILFQF